MHPSHQQTAGARGTSTNTKTSTEKEVLLKERALKRAEASKSRRVKAEEHHKTVSRITGHRLYLTTCPFF